MKNSILSYHNLLAQPEFKEAVKNNDKKLMDKLLHSVGVDVKAGYETVTILHRPLGTTKEWYGPVISYTERLDSEWIRGGAASMEAHVAACTDSTLRAELLGKCRSGTSIEQTWVSELENEFKK